MTDKDSSGGGAAAQSLAARMGPLDLAGRLSAIQETIIGPLVFTTSFGLEDQAIAHAIFKADLAIAVVTLDTGRLFAETYDLWSETEARYGRRIPAFVADQRSLEALVRAQGVNGFRGSVAAREACCGIRKVEPLGRALAGAAGWVTGLRAEQSQARAATPLAAWDRARGLIKINPLADWRREAVAAYVADNAIPANPLHDRGFLSIGCAPCTRAVRPGEPERAGRWWWEAQAKKECGLHLPQPAAVPAAAGLA